MIRQTDLAKTIELAADKAKYDEYAKKLLTYESVVAWILKSCTREFSQYSVKFIADNCLKDKPEISKKAVHQDQLDKENKLDGDKRIDVLNTEANSIKDQTVYYDIRFKAGIPDKEKPLQLMINLEIQMNDTPGYPLVTRGFYYCARMISEQYGTVFSDEHYEKLQKVYSIWICPDPAKKRRNGLFKYRTVEENVFGRSYMKPDSYDLMEVVILNLGDAEQETNKEILNLLNVLFSATTSPEEKKKRLNDDFNIAMTAEFESEVREMCNLSEALVNQGVQQGIQQGI
ncbi:MAG: PD-(D/E)XK nuclease family transposase, partial [Lachnospiraceae bacterium]|nr:PD-(D/E)XK nuclease family transposase [Lachnospiraceae bacterium]